MWFLDGRAVGTFFAALKRPDPIPFEDWLKLDNPLDGAGPAADRLLQVLEGDHDPLELAAGAAEPSQK